jgi:NAD(P) transhydrogenase subunit alpha
VDLAVEQGGNCALSQPDRIVTTQGITIIGYSNLPALVAADASALYARNILSFVNLLIDPTSGELRIDRSDEIISASLVCTDGAMTRTEEVSRA